MSRCAPLAVVVALTLSSCITISGADGAAWWGGVYEHVGAPVTESLPIAPGGTVTIDVEAGSLEVRGTPGSDVVVTGTSAARSAAALAETRFVFAPVGGGVLVGAETPAYTKVDLVVEVPAGCLVVIRDGSGDVDAADVAAVEVDDGSGSLSIRRVDGHVLITDGSGSIDVYDVGGPVTITDGSGSIDVEGVLGDVTVTRDGSGSIAVADVGGAFRVLSDGSGGVSHRGVLGEVRIDD